MKLEEDRLSRRKSKPVWGEVEPDACPTRRTTCSREAGCAAGAEVKPGSLWGTDVAESWAGGRPWRARWERLGDGGKQWEDGRMKTVVFRTRRASERASERRQRPVPVPMGRGGGRW